MESRIFKGHNSDRIRTNWEGREVFSLNGEALNVKEENLRNKVFSAYEEANILFKQGDLEGALKQYNSY